MSVHDEWMKSLAASQEQIRATGIPVTLPPPSMIELGLQYQEVKPGVSMKANLPFQKRFSNPVGTFQGGFLAAGVDDVFGPLSYVTAGRPCLTLSLNMTFLKAFTEKMQFCTIEGFILNQTKTLIFMRAEVKSPEGVLLAHAESHVSILRDDQVKK